MIALYVAVSILIIIIFCALLMYFGTDNGPAGNKEAGSSSVVSTGSSSPAEGSSSAKKDEDRKMFDALLSVHFPDSMTNPYWPDYSPEEAEERRGRKLTPEERATYETNDEFWARRARQQKEADDQEENNHE